MQKIKQDEINIGANIREIRLSRGIGQTELVRMVQLQGVDMTRECLVKIERGMQHILNCTHKNGQKEKQESKKQDKSGF